MKYKDSPFQRVPELKISGNWDNELSSLFRVLQQLVFTTLPVLNTINSLNIICFPSPSLWTGLFSICWSFGGFFFKSPSSATRHSRYTGEKTGKCLSTGIKEPSYSLTHRTGSFLSVLLVMLTSKWRAIKPDWQSKTRRMAIYRYEGVSYAKCKLKNKGLMLLVHKRVNLRKRQIIHF